MYKACRPPSPYAKAGSALLIVLFISALLLVGMTSIWRATHFFYESAYMRQRIYQIQCSAHACLYQAIARCWSSFQVCYESISPEKETIILQSAVWPLDSKHTCHARVFAQPRDTTIQLRVELMDDDKRILWRTRCICGDKTITQWSDTRD